VGKVQNQVGSFHCACGLSFDTREKVREHIKACKGIARNEPTCTGCQKSSRILLSYGQKRVCPCCSILYDDPVIVSGVPLINHMTPDHARIFSQKVAHLLGYLDVEKLSDLGIMVALITFTIGPVALPDMLTRDGELIFLFPKNEKPRVQELNKRAFEHVVNHEVLHAYVSNRLRWGIVDSMKGLSSSMEQSAVILCEDIQLDKVAISESIEPFIIDEIRRCRILYEELPVLTTSKWDSYPEGMRFNLMMSLTRIYAQELWFNDALKSTNEVGEIRKNLSLIQPHFNKWGNPELARTIREIYFEKVAQTPSEKQTMSRKILACSDSWAERQRINLY